LIALDLLVFFVIYQPLGVRIAEVTGKHEGLRQTIRNEQIRVDVLTKYEAALPAAGKELEDFSAQRTPSHREAYSAAAHLIHRLADASGIKIAGMAYHLDTEQHDPLQRLALEVSLEGPYASLLKFSHGLETANEFISVREFNFGPQGDKGALQLRLGADLYLTP